MIPPVLTSAFISILVLLISGTISWAFVAYLIPSLSQNFLDQPNSRSSHSYTIPRGGGIAFVIVYCIASFLACLYDQTSVISHIPLYALFLSLVGLIDDKFNLPASIRYGVQLLTALLLMSVSNLVLESPIFLSNEFLLIFGFLFFLSLSVTAIINFINFMDGLDGLVAGCMSVVISCIAIKLYVSWSLWVLVGSLLGFLVWNWSPAKVFMGDVGSTFLGAVFAGFVLQSSSWLEALGFLLVGTPLLADAFVCVPRRLLAGQKVFQPHRLHLFQRLHQAGWSHVRVSSMYIYLTAFLALIFLFGGLFWLLGFVTLVIIFGIWLDQCFAVPFSKAYQR